MEVVIQYRLQLPPQQQYKPQSLPQTPQPHVPRKEHQWLLQVMALATSAAISLQMETLILQTAIAKDKQQGKSQRGFNQIYTADQITIGQH